MRQYVIGRNGAPLMYGGNLLGFLVSSVTEIDLGMFTGYGDLYSGNVWKDGDKIYFNETEYTYEFDKGISTWVLKKWNNLPYSFYGNKIWTDGTKIYFSDGNLNGGYLSSQYVLNGDNWEPKEWFATNSDSPSTPYRWAPNRTYVWTDGSNIYYSFGLSQKVLDISTSTWNPKTWTVSDIDFDRVLNGNYIWSDGSNIYCSTDSFQTAKNYLLNPATSTWESVTFTGGPERLNGSNVWRTQNNTYYSSGTKTYRLTPSTRTWTDTGWSIEVKKPWYDGQYWHSSTGYDGGYVLNAAETSWTASNHKIESHLMGGNMWSSGGRVFMSDQFDVSSPAKTYELDLTTNTLSDTGWTTSIIAESVWHVDGNTYYSRGSTQLQFDPQTSTWSNKTWYGLPSHLALDGSYTWTDGIDTYYSYLSYQYVLDKETSTWETKTWDGTRRPKLARGVWKLGNRVFYSVKGGSYSGQLVKEPGSNSWVLMDWGGWEPEATNIWQFNGNVYCTGPDYSYKLNKTTMTWEEISLDSLGFTDLAYVLGRDVFVYGNRAYYVCSPAEYIMR